MKPVRRRLRALAWLLTLGMLGVAISPVAAQVIPGSPFGGSTGSSSGATAPFSDATALVKNAADATKLFKMDPSGVTTGNTVTFTLTGTAAAPVLTITGGQIVLGDGATGTPSFRGADADTGIWFPAANEISIGAAGGTGGTYTFSGTAAALRMSNDRRVGWTATNASAALDTAVRRLAAGVVTQTGATATSIGTMLGGGANVASADPLPAATGNVFHVTGTTSFTNFTTTNFVAGACFTMIFDGVLTLTDGGNMKLSANYTTTADDTLSVCYDGTNFYETGRSVN